MSFGQDFTPKPKKSKPKLKQRKIIKINRTYIIFAYLVSPSFNVEKQNKTQVDTKSKSKVRIYLKFNAIFRVMLTPAMVMSESSKIRNNSYKSTYSLLANIWSLG